MMQELRIIIGFVGMIFYWIALGYSMMYLGLFAVIICMLGMFVFGYVLFKAINQ